MSLIDNTLAATGTSASELGHDTLAGASVIYTGLATLGAGAVLAGMVIGAAVAFIIDRNFLWAGGYLVGAAALSFIGIISAEKVELNANPQVTLGYLFAAAACFAFMLMKLPRREKEADELALDAAEGISLAPAEDEVVLDAAPSSAR